MEKIERNEGPPKGRPRKDFTAKNDYQGRATDVTAEKGGLSCKSKNQRKKEKRKRKTKNFAFEKKSVGQGRAKTLCLASERKFKPMGV